MILTAYNAQSFFSFVHLKEQCYEIVVLWFFVVVTVFSSSITDNYKSEIGTKLVLTDPGGIDQKNRDRKLVTVSHYMVKVKKNSFQKRRKIAN